MTVVRHARAEVVRAGPKTGTWIFTGAELRCAVCGTDDLFSIRLGTEQTTRANAMDLGGRKRLVRGVPARAWCWEHFPWRESSCPEIPDSCPQPSCAA